MAERILVTGGAGFLGLHLARRLLRDGAEVVLLDDFSRARRDPELAEVLGHAELVEHDLTEPLDLTGRFDTVLHLAGVVGVARANDDPGRVLSVNLRSTLTVLDFCRRAGVGTLFFASTSEVGDGAAAYPTPETVPFVLADPAAPRSSYALSKLVGESLLRQAGGTLRVRVGRLYNVYGPRMGHSHVIPQFVERARSGADPFAVHGAGQTRSFCYVDDAVEAILALTRLPAADPLLVNVGDDREEVEVSALARRVCALAGYEPAFERHPAAAGSPDRRLPDLTALRALTGHEPAVDLATGLRRTYDWYAAR